jgi:energy-coupling factor transport system substrate-specific component
VTRVRPTLVYVLVVVVGAAAFLWPFFLAGHALPNQAHSGDAPLWAALVGAAVVAAVALEVRQGTMTGTTVALLGVLSAVAGLLRLLALPGGGNGIYFLVILAGVAFGPRFGLLLGLLAMAVSAVVTGGIGPWLPFQMLALSWMGAGAGLLGRFTRRLSPSTEVGVIAVYGWGWAFLYGAILNLWFWPFQVDGGALSYSPNLSTAETMHHYWSFYVASSFAWDAAGALANAILIVLTGRAILRSLRRFAGRLDPIVELVPLESPNHEGTAEGTLSEVRTS